jgi:protease IV
MHSRLVLALLAVLSLSGCSFNFHLFPEPGPLRETQVSGTGKAKVLLMEVSGVISSQDEDGLVSAPNMIARIKEQLSRATQDESVKAVVLRINTPGGTVTASDIIHHELKNFKANRKIPIIASIMDVGASGGYYIAAAADSVLAHPSSVTGSIGVIMLTMNARGLLEKVGVEATAVISGPRKDMGSPFRTMTTEERAIFQSVIDSFYQRFLTVVQEGRPQLQMEAIKKLADGRIYTGDQAKAAGLVDEIGYLDDAVELAKKRAGLTEARVVTYRRPGEYSNNVYSKLLAPGPLASLGNLDLLSFVRGGAPQFMYMWMP